MNVSAYNLYVNWWEQRARFLKQESEKPAIMLEKQSQNTKLKNKGTVVTYFDRLVTETKDVFEDHILKNRFIELILNGELSDEQYVSYLIETYHMVRHTCRMLTLASVQFDGERPDLQHFFLEHAEEEFGHDKFCITDISNMGYDPEILLKRQPMRGSWGLFTQGAYLASYGPTHAILGVASLTESLGPTLGEKVMDGLLNKCNIPSKAFTFIRSHTGFDEDHLAEIKDCINKHLKNDDELNDVIQARKMTAIHYGQMFTDAVENPVTFGRVGTKAA